MDKQLIERIARHTVNEFWSEEIDNEFVTMINVIVERIDAERGKSCIECLHKTCMFNGEQRKPVYGDRCWNLHNLPTIPEGMALVPIDRIEKLLEYSDKDYVPNTLFEQFRAMLAAAQG